MITDYVKIVKNLPLELQQDILSQSLKNLDDADTYYYGGNNYYESVWDQLVSVIKYVSFNPRMTIDIQRYVTSVRLSLSAKISIQFLRRSNGDSPLWVRHISDFKLASLKVNVNALDPEKDGVVVKLVSIILKQFDPPELITTSTDIVRQRLLIYGYHWIDRITTIEDMDVGDCGTLCQTVDQFKNLNTVVFNVFDIKSVCLQTVRLKYLLTKLDKIVFKLGGYSLRLSSDQIEDAFLSFVEDYKPDVDLQLHSFKFPLDKRGYRLLSNASRIDYYYLQVEDVFGIQHMSSTDINFSYLPKVQFLKSLTIDIPNLNNVKLESATLVDLHIRAHTLEAIDLSGITKLSSLSLATYDTLDFATVNSIPRNVTTLNIRADFSPMSYLFPVPKYVQTFRTMPEMLGHFDFSESSHICSLYLDTHKLDEIYEDYHTWKYIPSTIDFISLEYTHESVLFGPNDHTRSNKMFGITIPDTIPEVELAIQFMDERPRCDVIYINSERQSKSSMLNYVTGTYNGNEAWARIIIGSRTQLDLVLYDINEDVLVVCDDCVIDRVNCYLKESNQWFYKIKGKGGVSYLSASVKNHFVSCSIM